MAELSTIPKLLSARELEILQLAANGASDKQISETMGVQISTVRTYVNRARFKLHGLNRTHTVSIAVALGLIDVDYGALQPQVSKRKQAKIGQASTKVAGQ